MKRGVTILEVLFSILITSIGILGSIAVFVVVGTQQKRATVNDVAGASGRSAVHDFDTRGMRRPDKWVGWPVPWNVPPVGPPPALQAEFVPKMANLPRGTSFCLDPQMIALNASLPAESSLFPYVPRLNAADPRMFRISLHHGKPLMDGQGNRVDPRMSLAQANSLFSFNDDLDYLRPGEDDTTSIGIPNDRSLPPIQDFTRYPKQRQTKGNFSWIATLVPKVELYSGQVSDEYVLSVVVFSQRAIYQNCLGDGMIERVVDAQFQDDGSTGGEILLHARNGATSDTLKLRRNDWVLVSANQVLGNRFVPRFQWYRVTNATSPPELGNTLPFTTPGLEIYATLIGPDWNTGTVHPRFPNARGAVEVTLVQGVVAVYEKTMRLDVGSTF